MKTILVLTDFSKKAEHAAKFAVAVAAEANAEIILYHAFNVPQPAPVFPPEPLGAIYTPPSFEEYNEIEQESLQQLTKLQEQFKNLENGVRTSIKIINEPGNLADNVSDLLKKEKIWMIVMGEKRKSDDPVTRFFLSSDTYEVINRSTCPVLLIPEKSRIKPIKKLAFATDLDETDYEAIKFIAEMAGIYHAEIVVAHVILNKVSKEDTLKDLEHLKNLSSRVNYYNIKYRDILADELTESLEEFTRIEEIDILAMVHKKRTFLERIFRKNTIKEILNLHNTPLLVYPEKQ